MSERIYAWLLRLYPDGFRNEFGEEARLLIRDRLRNETGFRSRLRFWFDVIADFVRSLAHEHSLPEFRTAGVSFYYDLGDQSPRRGPLCVGALLTLIFLFNFPKLIELEAEAAPVFRTVPASSPGGFSGLRSLWSFWFQGLGTKSRPDSPLPKFEVAVIKPYRDLLPEHAPPVQLGCRGMDGVSETDPGLAHDIPMGRCVATFIPLQILVAFAYRIPTGAFRAISGAPEWMLDRFDLDAKSEQPTTEAQLRLMLQSLLAERFKLSVHWEAKQSDVLTLVVVDASKLKPSKVDGECVPRSPSVPCGIVSPSGDGSSLHGERVSIAALIKPLSIFTRNETPIVDATGLTGLYDISTTGVNLRNDPNSLLPDLTTMLKEQLGLSLRREKRPTNVLVVDHVEKLAP